MKINPTLIIVILILVGGFIFMDKGQTQATTNVSSCSDTDGGKIYTIKGYGIEYNQYSFADYCIDSNILNEAYCDSSISKYESYNCKNLGINYFCSNGECIQETSICTDTEGNNIDYMKKGMVTDSSGTFTDSCSGDILTDYFCIGNSKSFDTINCKTNWGYSCSNGACVCSGSCSGKTCGDDGCGHSCGTCSNNLRCSDGKCISQDSCIDTDGNSLTTKGTVTDIINGVTSIYTDYCENKVQVHEYTCNEHMAGNVISCSLGLECNNGICSQPQQTGCNIKGDNEPCGCISDLEFPTIVSNWLNMNGVSDSQFPTAVKSWLDQGC